MVADLSRRKLSNLFKYKHSGEKNHLCQADCLVDKIWLKLIRTYANRLIWFDLQWMQFYAPKTFIIQSKYDQKRYCGTGDFQKHLCGGNAQYGKSNRWNRWVKQGNWLAFGSELKWKTSQHFSRWLYKSSLFTLTMRLGLWIFQQWFCPILLRWLSSVLILVSLYEKNQIDYSAWNLHHGNFSLVQYMIQKAARNCWIA